MEKLPVSKLVRNQKMKFHTVADGMDMTATVRHDDNCGNGHNSFAITLDAYEAGKPKTDRYFMMAGCCHDEVKKYFPQLAHLIKWHLTSTDGPMHYLANTLYLAGDKDCDGKRAGEPINPERLIKFQDFPILWRGSQAFIKWLETLENYDLEVMAVHHKDNAKPGSYQFKPKYTFLPYQADTWHRAPFDSETEALEFLGALNNGPVEFITVYTDKAKGKEPELEAARSAAVWPDATLEQLTDKTALMARLAPLMEEFRADVEALGMEY